jgi:hypothetical protein
LEAGVVFYGGVLAAALAGKSNMKKQYRPACHIAHVMVLFRRRCLNISSQSLHQSRRQF